MLYSVLSHRHYFIVVSNKQQQKLTWRKSILLHSVPVVQESKRVVPNCAPDGGDCMATQLTSAVLFEPSLYS